MANTIYSASLVMTADVSQAKAQLENLQKSINGLLKNSHNSSPLGLTTEINQALSKVSDLKVALDSAMNVKTGKLDLSKFSASIKASGTDIAGYAKTLQSLGPAGQQAFSQLAQSIMSAEVPLKKTNQLLDNFKTTLANTVKWQISSSMVNSLVGAMQRAYGYAQDLNKSLNDIRIVTGYSTDQMSKFAKEANNAAKALSTTTTQYTDAALIYYQQGLAEKDIKARTDATIKMANVTGESAKAVSDYMTAIWNNFDNGSKSLEYYADVMTALGAATASSTDEIAAGLEKFAAVSETVGLSYEYATAALATVTAETRQSADVVGNAFKTLFSRIQGLSLGETLEDGTDLNKYSAALAQVGVNIKESNGQLKDMDVILDELGTKWGTLSNDTQMALAQTVAGVRQYNQLISLMNNWDTFKINLDVALDSEGTLQEQADIYAESWEAASNRVRASFEDIYDSILKDEFFIKLTDFFGGLLDIIGNTIDGIGGMGGAFAALGVIISRVWGKDIGKAISSLTYNPTKAQDDAKKLREETNTELTKVYRKDTSQSGQARYQAYSAQANVQNSVLEAQARLEDQGTQLTEIEKAKAAILSQQTIELGKQLTLTAEIAEKEEAEYQKQQAAYEKRYRRESSVDDETMKMYTTEMSAFRKNSKDIGLAEAVSTDLQASLDKVSNNDSFEKLKKSVKSLSVELNTSDDDVTELKKHLDQLSNTTSKDEFAKGLKALNNEITEANNKTDELYQNLKALDVTQDQLEYEYTQSGNAGINELNRAGKKIALDEQEQSSQKEMKEFKGVQPNTIDSYVALAEAISMCALGVTSLIGLFDVWNNQDMSFGEKLLTTFTTLETVIPMIATSFSGANKEMLIAASNSIRTSLGFSAVGASGVAAGAGGAAAGTGFGAAAAGLWSLLWPIGLVIAGLTALVGIIYLVAEAFDNSNFTLEEQLERAKLSTEELTTELENTKNAAEELNNAFDNYNSIVSKIDECTEGTREYREALLEANNAAIELLNQHPELYGIDGAIEKSDGIIKITEKGQEALQESAEQKEQNINAALIDQRADVRQAELDIKERDLNKKIQQGTGQVFTDEFKMQGHDMTQYLSEQRTASDGTAYTFTAQQRIDEAIQNAYNSLKNNPNFTKEDWDKAFSDATSGFEVELKNAIDYNAIYDWAESIRQSNFELQQAIDANTYQTKLENENIVKQALGEAGINKSDAEIALLGAEYDKVSSEIEDIILKGLKDPWRTTDLEDINKIKIGEESYSGEDIWNMYNEAIGKNLKLDDNSIIGGEDSRFIQYVDEESGDTKKVSIETVASTIAAAEALKQLENGSINAANALQEISNIEVADVNGNGINVGDSIKSYIANGDMSGLSEQQIMDLTGGDGEFADGEVAKLFEGLDSTTQEAIWKAAGATSWDAFLTGFEADAESMDFSTIFSNLKSGKAVEEGTFKDLSYNLQEDIAEALDNAFTVGGKKASDNLFDLITIAAEQGVDKVEQVMSLISSYNFETGSMEEFSNLVYEIIGYSDSAATAVEGFGSEMEAAGDRIPLEELDEFISKIESILVLLGKLEIGDIIDDDAIEQLKAMGIAVEEYAIKTLEGWKLIKDIPTDKVEETYAGALQAGQEAYGTMNTEGTTGYIQNGKWVEGTSYDVAQSKIGSTDTSGTAGWLQGATMGWSKDTIESVFGMSYDEYNRLTTKDYSNSVYGVAAGTTAEYDAMLEAYMRTYTQGQNGAFEQTNIDTSLLYAKGSDSGLTSMSQMKEFRNEDGSISQAGANALQGFASDDEIYSDALKDYQKALEEAGEDTKAVNDATEDFYKRLKKIENTKAAKNIADLQDSMKDMTEGSQEYESAIGDMQQELEKVFGKEISEEWIKNNQDVIKQWTSGATEAERALAGMEIEALGGDGAERMIEVGLAVDTEQAQEKIQEAFSMIENLNLEPMVLECVGQGDFSALIGQLTATGASADQVAAILSAIGSTTLSPEGFAKIAEALKALQVALQDPTNEDAVDAAIEAFNNEYQMAMVGESPDVPPDMQTHTGSGGGGGKDKADRDKLSDALADTYEKKRQRLKAQYEGLDPESASKYIKEEIALLEEEQKILEEQVKTWKGLLKTKVQEFNQEYADELGFDLRLNDDGEIANLSEIYQRLIQMYDEGNTDLVDKIYDKLQESAGIQASIDEAVQGIMDKEREQAELELKDITDRIDWRIKQIDYQIKRLNYYQEKLLTQAHGNKQTIEAMLEGFQYQEQEMLKLFEKGEALRQGIDELNAAKAKYPNHQQMFNEQILEYQSDLIDVNQDILELRADMEELVKEVLELALDEIDIQNERINKYVSMLDRFQNIIDLSGRSILDQALKVEIGTAKLDTLINKMSISKQTMEGLAEATKLAQEALERRAADGDETSVSMWENQVEELERELEAAQDDFLANWEEVLQAAADIFDMRVQLTVQTLEDALSPFSNLSILEDRYNKEKELQDKYLDDATKLYELNKLNRQLNQSITDENDLLAKSKLRDIQEEILAYQKAGVDMSQYDLDILQKKYDLRLAEIALMEAQNSKTSMRLIRDAAGNWTYAYDADQTAIDEALQSVEDATYSLKKASTDYIDEMTEEMIAIKKEFVEAIGGLDKNSADYMEQLLYLQQHYIKEYNVVLGEFKKGVEGAGLTIHDTWYGATLDLYNFEDAQKHFSDASDLAINELMVNYKDWQKVVEQAMGIAGTSWETFGDDTGATLDSLEEHIQALCDEISKLVDVLMEYVAVSIGMVEEWQAKYSKQVDNELARNEAYINNDSLHQSRSGGGGKIDYLAEANGDYSLAMTLLIANEGQAGLNSQQFQDLSTARTKKINEDANLKAQIGNQIITTEHLINVLTDSSKSESALGSDVIASAGGYLGDVKINYTQNNYQLSQDDEYESQSGLIFDFINGERGGGFLSTFIPSPNYGINKNYEYYNNINDPRSGWCSKWVGDVMAYNGADFIRGNAWDAVKRNSGRAYNGGYIANGTAVGSDSGEYGHIGIYNDGYIYATSYSGNSLDRYTVDEWQKKYGKLYITNAGNIQAGQTAIDIFNKKNGNTYGSGLISNLLYGYEVDNNIKSQSNGQSLISQMLKGFDTGGYTGAWGPYGRLALLHEKELVLNKADTSNILDAVKISRGIDDKISSMVVDTNNQLKDLLSFIKLPKFETQPIEQTVQIQAEFPGVTDQYEIQEALSNLSNDASQYLNIQRDFW